MTILRSSNIRCLSYSRHFVRPRQGCSVTHLLLSVHEAKNSLAMEIPLPERTIVLLRSYIHIYQPIVSRGHATDLLFPGTNANPKCSTGFFKQIINTIVKHTGLEMNPHLFRHLAALTFLKAHPGEYETVRRFLGHKSIATTINFYVGLEAIAAFRRYDEVILAIGSAPRSLGKRNRHRTTKL
jgi:site-specific recombinase XerD